MRRSVRISDPDGSATIMLNKIGLFESVIAILPDAHKKEASEELKILQSIFEKSYLKSFNRLKPVKTGCTNFNLVILRKLFTIKLLQDE